MESLPLELLHRVFRLLPPATFYKVIPRLCHRFRFASRGAIPGCPGDTVGVCYEIEVRDDGAYNNALLPRRGQIEVVTLLGNYRVVKTVSSLQGSVSSVLTEFVALALSNEMLFSNTDREKIKSLVFNPEFEEYEDDLSVQFATHKAFPNLIELGALAVRFTSLNTHLNQPAEDALEGTAVRHLSRTHTYMHVYTRDLCGPLREPGVTQVI
ncbi:hypothetical protein M427DRAFT_72055 [Gonapodya prolifera JEL478]|uniref:F-box domain-containing protein n=1 Tax=Gonapodya prolifera (strain JEL478) TaxID=1344416 RepID=A0A139A6T6_GONPJ|nr:hypothetical protein M427DRAFT_72055 [Gonapodya prolifera JEL478]|eukprot:KXS12414.1 hypothetical protein M427DRAFT_72055 [Gonapodya prolifera JEL478]